jgi:metal-dependent amidase/aminoacylase/carboxypeptidase family protein
MACRACGLVRCMPCCPCVQARKVLFGSAASLGCKLELVTSSLDTSCLRQAPPAGAPGSCTFPPTVNNGAAWAVAKAAARSLVASPEDVWDAQPTMGGEDFAYFLEKIPGAMVFLGIGNATLGTDVNLHSPRFQMDEAQLHLGAALHVEFALRSLSDLASPASKLGCSRVLEGAGSDDDDPRMAAQCAQGTALEAED